MASENGWEPAWVGQDKLIWVTVPGTDVHLQTQKGQPSILLPAFAADFNAYVEPLRDRDSASYTPTNSVPTSNHLNGTAMDLNWDSHPFRILDAGFSKDQIRTIRELLHFYEGTIWWGNDWDVPKDSMHFQLGYDTYNNPATADFIKRKIRSDGFSTFRRSSAVPPLSTKDRYALAIIEEGRRRGMTPRGIRIALATALVESNLVMYANSAVPESLNLPHEAVGSDYDSVGLFQQRCPMWGPAAVLMDPAKSAGLFYDRLADLDYNGSKSPGWYAQAVQRSAFPDRYDQRYGDATAIYDRLAGQGDDMALVPQEQWDQVFHALTDRLPSRSIYRTPGEGAIDTVAGMLLNVDAMTHAALIERLARLGNQDAVGRLARTAAGQGAVTDRHAIAQAQSVLADIENTNPAILTQYLKG